MIGRPIKAKALVFVVFLLGIASGVLIANIYSSRVSSAPVPPQRAQRDINKFYDYLGLNQEQREQMHKIGEETRQKFQDLRKETHPRFEAIQEESRVKIRAVLNDEQRKKYDDFRKKMDEQRRNRELDSKKDPGSKNNQGPRQ
jgi:Spy/CpxP family protein refolding chaperone